MRFWGFMSLASFILMSFVSWAIVVSSGGMTPSWLLKILLIIVANCCLFAVVLILKMIKNL